MNKTALIFRHELICTLRRKGFIIMTLLVPLLALLAIFALRLASSAQQAPAAVNAAMVGYVDEAGGFRDDTGQGDFRFIVYDSKSAALSALGRGDISGYFVIPKDYVASGRITLYSLDKRLTPPSGFVGAVCSFLSFNLLNGKVPQTTIDRVNSPADVSTVTLTREGSVVPVQGGYLSIALPIVFAFLLALAIIFSSTYMLQGLGEEKENRLMDVLLSSVSPRQLLMGKVAGLGLAGLLQVAVWMATLPPMLGLLGSSISMLQLPAGFLFFNALFFILGYLLFALIAAAIGAISATTQEGHQLSALFTLFALSPVWCLSIVMLNPNSPLLVVLSIFPLTAPVLVMERLGLTNVPAWQLAASIAVLALSIVGGLWLASKIFRVYLLSYGKRSKLAEIVRNLGNTR